MAVQTVFLAAGYLPEAWWAISTPSLTMPGTQSARPDCSPILEQMTTDFDKALRSVDAPFTLALGFAGARIDHGLAVLNSLVRHPDRRCLVIGPRDVVFHAPARLQLALRRGDRFSLFPMAPVTAESTGLDWPTGGIAFAPHGMIGTSNRVTEGPVTLAMDGPGMLVILPRTRLDAALTALLAAG